MEKRVIPNHKFIARVSGDHECFTFAVTKEVYKKIKGKNPDKYAKNDFHKDLYNLYPNDIFGIGAKVIEVEIQWEVMSDKKLLDKHNTKEL